MNKTKRILVVSDDLSLIEYLKISSLTLTKLNCQVSLEIETDRDEILSLAKIPNLDLIIADLDNSEIEPVKLIKEIRNISSKKIIGVYSAEVNKENFFSAGCDSLMSKAELQRSAVNIIQY